MESKIAIGNDHGGYLLKMELMNHLQGRKYDVLNIGSDSEDIVRYPYYAAILVRKILAGEAECGILICSTGIGMSIIANKFKGIRAALCHNVHEAKMTAAHNNSNILCLGGRCIKSIEAIEIVDAWLNTAYEGGRHSISLGLIKNAEDINFSGGIWNPSASEIK